MKKTSALVSLINAGISGGLFAKGAYDLLEYYSQANLARLKAHEKAKEMDKETKEKGDLNYEEYSDPKKFKTGVWNLALSGIYAAISYIAARDAVK